MSKYRVRSVDVMLQEEITYHEKCLEYALDDLNTQKVMKNYVDKKGLDDSYVSNSIKYLSNRVKMLELVISALKEINHE